jgi:hypothetical protein
MRRIVSKFTGVLAVVVSLILTTVPLFAQTSNGYVPSAIQNSGLSTNPNSIITIVINFIFIIVGLIFFVMLVIAGVQWVTAGDAEDKREAAQKRIVNAIIGVAIVGGSYLVVEIIAGLLGIGGIFNNNLFTSNCSAGSTVCINGSLGKG